MKKMGLLSLVLVLALAGIGAGYAHWDQTLYIAAEAETGDINLGMYLATGAGYCGNPTSPPPEGYTYPFGTGGRTVPVGWGGTDDGNWDSPGQKDNNRNGGLGATCPAGPIFNWWGGEDNGYGACGPPGADVDATDYLLDKDVGSTTITGTDPDEDGDWETMTITINNTYPQYVSGATFYVVNRGSVPIKLTGFNVTTAVPTSALLVAILDYPPYWQSGCDPDWAWSCVVLDGTGEIQPCEILEQLDPGESALTGIYIEVLQTAEPGSSYTFTVELLAEQWNLVD